MSAILNYVLGIALIALFSYCLTLSAENSIYKTQAADAQAQLANESASRALRNAVLQEQNATIQKQADDLLKMQSAGAAAQAEADIEIGKLERKIDAIQKEPKSTTCEQVRQKMLRYALL